MIFKKTKLKDAYVIDIEKLEDTRGFFGRAYCRKEFETQQLIPDLVQCNISFNKFKNTIRGMHYQIAPHQEVKLVRCTRGAIYDVIIDLRSVSSSYKQWIGIELTADNYRMLYVPEGFAHGYQTLYDDTEVFYQVSQYYNPEFERGVRWNDPAFGIQWPVTQAAVISDKDENWSDFR